MEKSGDHTRTRRIGLIATAVVVAFLAGFVPQWLRVQDLESSLAETRAEADLLDLGGRLGAALAESQRGNYERARQLMTEFFSQLQERSGQVEAQSARAELQALLQQRDEIITLLSRAAPESVSRLNIMYSRYFAAVHPAGGASPAVTPAPPP